MEATQELGRNSNFRENATYDLIATTVICGATWRIPFDGRAHRSIMYEFDLHPLNSLKEIESAKCDLKT